MSSNIPDGISFADLQQFAKDAKSEDELIKGDGPYDGYTEQQLRRGVDEALESIHNRFGHPMTAKYILMETLQSLMLWHTKRGVHEFEDGDNDSGVAWLRDAGKLQSAMQVVHSVCLPDDWMVNDN